MSRLTLLAAPEPRTSTDHVGDACWEPTEVERVARDRSASRAPANVDPRSPRQYRPPLEFQRERPAPCVEPPTSPQEPSAILDHFQFPHPPRRSRCAVAPNRSGQPIRASLPGRRRRLIPKAIKNSGGLYQRADCEAIVCCPVLSFL